MKIKRSKLKIKLKCLGSNNWIYNFQVKKMMLFISNSQINRQEYILDKKKVEKIRDFEAQLTLKNWSKNYTKKLE